VEGPASAFGSGFEVAENGTIGVTVREFERFGTLAAACLMSGGVTRLGFCCGVTGIAGRFADCGAGVCLGRGCARGLGALP
jgi:hypothetical protein